MTLTLGPLRGIPAGVDRTNYAMNQRKFLTALVCFSLISASALAAPISKRKPTTNPQGSTSPATLQQILDGLVVSGPAIEADSSEVVSYWNAAAGPVTSQIVFDQTLKSEKVKLGLFDQSSPTTQAFLLSDTSHPSLKNSDIATVTFNDNTSITIRGGIQKKGNGFDGPFGFFIKDVVPHAAPVFLFTDASLNFLGQSVKVFQGNNQTMLKLPGQRPGVFLSSEFLLAFETGTDHGFNDILFLVSGLVPAVPEPTTLALMALSTLGVVFARRGRPV